MRSTSPKFGCGHCPPGTAPDQMQTSPSEDSFNVSLKSIRSLGAGTARRGRLPIKCKLSLSEDSFNVPLKSIRSSAAGTARPPESEIKVVPSYARRHISYLRSKYFTAKLFHLPVRANFITSSLFTVTSYFRKILTKGKRQVKSEE